MTAHANPHDEELRHDTQTQDDDAATPTPHSDNEAEATEQKGTLQALRELTADEDDPITHDHRPITLTTVLGGDILANRWFRRNVFFFIMIVAMLFAYIANRYRCQQEMIETKNLSDTLLDRKYKALVRSSQLKEKMRRAYIEDALADTTLETASTPAYNLKVDNE